VRTSLFFSINAIPLQRLCGGGGQAFSLIHLRPRFCAGFVGLLIKNRRPNVLYATHLLFVATRFIFVTVFFITANPPLQKPIFLIVRCRDESWSQPFYFRSAVSSLSPSGPRSRPWRTRKMFPSIVLLPSFCRFSLLERVRVLTLPYVCLRAIFLRSFFPLCRAELFKAR